jgi:hypothetical protein
MADVCRLNALVDGISIHGRRLDGKFLVHRIQGNSVVVIFFWLRNRMLIAICGPVFTAEFASQKGPAAKFNYAT